MRLSCSSKEGLSSKLDQEGVKVESMVFPKLWLEFFKETSVRKQSGIRWRTIMSTGSGVLPKDSLPRAEETQPTSRV